MGIFTTVNTCDDASVCYLCNEPSYVSAIGLMWCKLCVKFIEVFSYDRKTPVSRMLQIFSA